MDAQLNKLRQALSLLQPDFGYCQKVRVSSFWMAFEKWLGTIPNSAEDTACMKELKKKPAYIRELLLAYHILQNGTPLKRIIEERISLGEIKTEDLRDAIEALVAIDIIIQREIPA